MWQLGGGANATEQRGVLGGARRGEAPPPPLRLGKRAKPAFHQRGSRSPLPRERQLRSAILGPRRRGRGEQLRAGRQTKAALKRPRAPSHPGAGPEAVPVPPPPHHTQGRPRLLSTPVPKQKRRAGGGWGERAAGGCGRPLGWDAPPSPCQAAGGRGGERRGAGSCRLFPSRSRVRGGGNRAMQGAGQAAAAAGAEGRRSFPGPRCLHHLWGGRRLGRRAALSRPAPLAAPGPAPQRNGRAGTGGKHR